MEIIPIKLLRITTDVNEVWLTHWIKENGDLVQDSPQYLYLLGDFEPMWEWSRFRHMHPTYQSKQLMDVFKSIIYEGQKEPIKIYKDMRINTGHKRAACMLFLGAKNIKAEIVADDTKL